MSDDAKGHSRVKPTASDNRSRTLPRMAQVRTTDPYTRTAPPPGATAPPWAIPESSIAPFSTASPAPPERATKPPRRGRTKLSYGLVALSSAAILSVYAAGYVRTESADAQLNGSNVPASRVVAAAPVVLPTGTVVPLPTMETGSGSGFFFPNTPTPPAPTATLPAAAPTTNPVAAVVASSTAPAAPATQGSAPNGASGVPTPVPFTPPRTAAITPITALASVAPATQTARPTATSAPTVVPRVATSAAPAAAAATGKYKDGSYVGTGTSRRGGVEVTVIVQGGKITSAEITQCGTEYSCSRIAALPGQVVTRQSAAVNRVSGATYSTQAYTQAVTAALAQAGGA